MPGDSAEDFIRIAEEAYETTLKIPNPIGLDDMSVFKDDR